MSGKYLNIVLLLCFCGVLCVYYQKSERTSDHMDYMEKSLTGLKKILPPNALIRYYGIHTDTINGRENYPMARYALAPAMLEPAVDKSNLKDTILLIFRNNADSSVKFVNENTDIIWENRDSTYHFLLIRDRT